MSGAPPESFRDEELLADVICRLIGDVRHVAVGAASPYQGASGAIATQLNANNAGVGITSYASGSLPSSFPVGALILIGGILYVASRPKAAAVAAAA